MYRDRIVPLADVCLPNQFEAELLTGIKIETEADAVAVMDKLHAWGVKTVILSSTDLGDHDHLVGLASRRTDSGDRTVVKVRSTT